MIVDQEDTLEWLERRAKHCEDMSKISHPDASEYAESAERYRRHADHVRNLREGVRHRQTDAALIQRLRQQAEYGRLPSEIINIMNEAATALEKA